MFFTQGIFLIDACRSHKRASELLELELRAIVRKQYQCWQQNLGGLEEQQFLLTIGSSAQLWRDFLHVVILKIATNNIFQVSTSKNKLSLLYLDQYFTISFVTRCVV